MNPQGGSAAGYEEGQNRVGNVNQGGLDNAFDDDVDEQPIQDLALNVDNVFQAEDCDAFDSDVDEAPTAQTMFLANLSSADPVTDEARPSYDLDILSEDNEVPVVHSNASSVLNDTFMMMYDDMCEPSASSVSNSSRNAVVKNSLTAELATYRQQVELYERQAKFKLTEQEQKIDEQLRLVISDCNFKEETLNVAIGYKNPLCLTHTKQAQHALYNGNEILKDNHAPAKVHNTEDTLEIAEITRKKMNAKMTDPECVTHKGRPNRGQGMNPWGGNAAGYGEAQNKVGNVNQGQARPSQARTVKCYNCNDAIEAQENGVALDAEQLLFLAGGPDNAFDDDVDEQPIQDLALNVDNVFQAEDCDAFDSDYVKDNDVPDVHSNASSVLNDTFMMIYDHMCKPFAPSVSNSLRNAVVKNYLTAELATYREQVELIGNHPPIPDKDTPDFDSVFVIGKKQASLQGKDNAIRQLKKQLFELPVNSSDTERTVKVRTTDSQLTKMVNTRTDADLSAVVQSALQTLLPQIHAEIREEFRTSSGPSDSGGNLPPVTIHTWLERFNKQKPHSFEKATAPVDAEN
nr:zinc finger, CCHC-type, retrotransposon Gag domain protein [Tanacetum cinerariifolium]